MESKVGSQSPHRHHHRDHLRPLGHLPRYRHQPNEALGAEKKVRVKVRKKNIDVQNWIFFYRERFFFLAGAETEGFTGTLGSEETRATANRDIV